MYIHHHHVLFGPGGATITSRPSIVSRVHDDYVSKSTSVAVPLILLVPVNLIAIRVDKGSSDKPSLRVLSTLERKREAVE